MAIDFSGKVVIITGGAGGLGKAFTLEFAAAGADVVCNDLDPTEGEAVIAESAGVPGRVQLAAGSMGLPETCAAPPANAHELGGVDILYHNTVTQPQTNQIGRSSVKRRE